MACAAVLVALGHFSISSAILRNALANVPAASFASGVTLKSS
jgi:hypothetical protein